MLDRGRRRPKQQRAAAINGLLRRFRKSVTNPLEGLHLKPRDQHRGLAFQDRPGDARDLLGGLALPEDHLRRPAPAGAVVIDGGVTQRLHGIGVAVEQPAAELFRGLGNGQVTLANGFQDLIKGGAHAKFSSSDRLLALSNPGGLAQCGPFRGSGRRSSGDDDRHAPASS